MKKSHIIYVLTVVSFIFTAGASYSDILGCYKKVNGHLRVVDDFNECLVSEEPITLREADLALVGEYQGELCLAMPEYDNAVRFRIGKFFMGGIYYSLSGVQYSDATGQDQDVLTGSAVMINDHLEMVFTIVRTYADNDTGIALVSSQMAQIRWNETEQAYDLSVIDAKQYIDSSNHESLGDEYSSLVEVACPVIE